MQCGEPPFLAYGNQDFQRTLDSPHFTGPQGPFLCTGRTNTVLLYSSRLLDESSEQLHRKGVVGVGVCKGILPSVAQIWPRHNYLNTSCSCPTPPHPYLVCCGEDQILKLSLKACCSLHNLAISNCWVCVCVCGTGAQTQGLQLKPLHQPFFMKGFFKVESCKLFVQGWLQTKILLIFASWVARITGMSHWCPPRNCFDNKYISGSKRETGEIQRYRYIDT
jgi:hypothetical protein